jgi:hypothetical protein
MPRRPLLLALILLFTAAGAFGNQAVVRVKKAGENFRFELCEKESCETLGRENGYTRAELEHWKKFRESSTGEILPLMALTAGLSVMIAGLVFFPLTAMAAVGVIALGGFTYFFSKTPQVQARMPNDVYHEFQADPELLPALKNFLLEIDQGMPVADKYPRVLSGSVVKKSDRPQIGEQAPADAPVNHAK